MIPVKDLIKWAEEHAIGRSPSVPAGWVSSEQLIMLIEQMKYVDPLPYRYSLTNNMPEDK